MWDGEAAQNAEHHANFAEPPSYPSPENELEVPQRGNVPLSSVVMVFISVALTTMLCLPYGWHASDGGELQNYYLGLWRIEVEAFKLNATGHDATDEEIADRCKGDMAMRTVECGTWSILKSSELGCAVAPTAEDTTTSTTAEEDTTTSTTVEDTTSVSARRLLSHEAFTPDYWCTLWTQLSISSVVMLICGGCASLFFLISACVGRTQFAANHPILKVLLFCIAPFSSMGGLIFYAVTTFDFPSSCKDGADFCGLFVVYGFGPAFWASSILTLFGFVPMIVACATMPNSSRDIEDWQAYEQSFQPQYDQQAWQQQDPSYAGYPPQDMNKGLLAPPLPPQPEGVQPEYITEFHTHRSIVTVKRVKRGHCVSCTIVFVAVFLAVSLCMPFGWLTSTGGDRQKYYIGLWRIEAEPQNMNFTSGETIVDQVELEARCAMTADQIPCQPPPLIFKVTDVACGDQDSDWCKRWHRLYIASLVMLICGGVSVLLFVIGLVYAQCKYASGARCLKLVFLGLAPAVSIGGLVFYYIETKDFPTTCLDGEYSCNLWGFGPVFWGAVLLSGYGLVPMMIVAFTRPAPRESMWVGREDGVELSKRELDIPNVVLEGQAGFNGQAGFDGQASENGFRIGDRVECRSLGKPWRDGVVDSIFPIRVKPDGWDFSTTFDEVRVKATPQPMQEAQYNQPLQEESAPVEDVQEEAQSAEPEPPAQEEPKESWTDMLARIAAEKKKKQEEEAAAKQAEEEAQAAIPPTVEEPAPEIKISVAPVVVPDVRPDDTPQKQEAQPSPQEQQNSGKVRIDLLNDQSDDDGPTAKQPEKPQEKCWNCGAVLPPTAKFCNECGSSRVAPTPKSAEVPGSTGGGSPSKKKGLRGGRDRTRQENVDSEPSRNLSPQPPRNLSPPPIKVTSDPFRNNQEQEIGHKSELAKMAATALKDAPKRDYALPVPQGNFSGFRQSNAPPENFLDDDRQQPTYPGAPPQFDGGFSSSAPNSSQPGGYQLSTGPVQVTVSEYETPGSMYKSPSPNGFEVFGVQQRPISPRQQMGFGGQQPPSQSGGLKQAAEAALGSNRGFGSQQPPSQQGGYGSQLPQPSGFGSQQPQSSGFGFQQQSAPSGFQYQGGQAQSQPGYQQQSQFGSSPQPFSQSNPQPSSQAASGGDFGLSAPSQTPQRQQPQQPPAAWGFTPPGMNQTGFGMTPSSMPIANNQYHQDLSQMPRTTPASPSDGYNQFSSGQPQQQPASWGYMPSGGQNFSRRQ